MTRGSRSGVPLSTLVATLLALFAADNLLLLAFLGLSPLLTILAALIVCPLIAVMGAKAIKTDIIVPWNGIAIAGFVALTLFLLGGQGRFFYANADWQVRDALLADLVRYPWPFGYTLDGESTVLRAPLGLYLLPSLAGKGAEFAMLASNTLRLTLLFALCWPLFTNKRARWIGLAVFFLFSGLDVVGTAIFDRLGIYPGWDHIERWNFNNQYSAHITQAFWVPNHALAGWTCVVAFLLWHGGFARIGLFAAAIPLVAIWSPLVIMGSVPFALLAGAIVLWKRDWGLPDALLAMAALFIALPALAYQQLDAAALSSSARNIGLFSYVLLMMLEVMPFVVLPLLSKHTDRRDRVLLWLIFACLALMPLYQLGGNSDFQMRASIMPLALLSFLFAKWLTQSVEQPAKSRTTIGFAMALLALGAVTPAFELRRAFMLPPSPKPLCSLAGVWENQQGLMITSNVTYFARISSLPKALGNIPVLAGKKDPEICWDRPWTQIDTPQ
jgi:hypothetical protein